MAEGNWKTFAISFAAVSSGLMIMLNPNSFWRKSFSSLYIGLRMRGDGLTVATLLGNDAAEEIFLIRSCDSDQQVCGFDTGLL